jgi:hypothetical protein
VLTTYHRTIDDQQVSERDAFDERGLLRDGHAMRTKLLLMDGVPVMPLTDEQRRAQIDGYKTRVSNAWREPAAQFRDDGGDAKPSGEALARMGDPYQRYDQRIQDAWR